ncbi:MAG TPA: hypothetical protein VK906_12290 [Egicoccus sp.]|nr:hypothetical protein [Egicoccus sp.]HSK23953.1 hypothetical protein [Egicoccus sp.]
MSTATRSVSPGSSPSTVRQLVPPLAIVDLVVAAVLLAVAITNPLEAPAALRWALVGVGDLALVLAAVAVARARRGRTGPAGRR